MPQNQKVDAGAASFCGDMPEAIACNSTIPSEPRRTLISENQETHINQNQWPKYLNRSLGYTIPQVCKGTELAIIKAAP